VNLCTNSVVSFVSLPVSLSSGTSFANDVTVLEGVAYVSDSTGNQIYQVDITPNSTIGGSFFLSNPRVLFNSVSGCASNSPSTCLNFPDGMASINSSSPPLVLISNLNGASGPGGLMKYTPSSGVLVAVTDPTGIVSGLDGMKFNAAKTVLYGCRGSTTKVYQTVVAAVSCDEWSTASLAFSFQVNCGGSNPTALNLIENTDGTEDLVIMCNDGFGAGPYPIQIVRDVNAIVLSQPVSSSCPQAATSSPTSAPTSSPTSAPTSSPTPFPTSAPTASNALAVKAFAGTVAGFLGVVFLATLFWNWKYILENYGCVTPSKEEESHGDGERKTDVEMHRDSPLHTGLLPK